MILNLNLGQCLRTMVIGLLKVVVGLFLFLKHLNWFFTSVQQSLMDPAMLFKGFFIFLLLFTHFPAAVFQPLMSVQTGFTIGAQQPSGLHY